MQAKSVETPRDGDVEPPHESYIPPETHMREFTVRGVVMGTILGVIFGASSLYLVLKVGITVSASIPVAVISITLFRVLSKVFGIKDATILEHNIVQTSGSAGESLAFGVGVTMPAIMILGFDLEITRVMLVALLGGLLGVLMMIPLRRALIVRQHGTLKYPEGTACAEVLKAGASEESRAMASPAWGKDADAAKPSALRRGTSAIQIFSGFGVGLLYNVLMRGLHLWKDTPEKVFGAAYKGGSVSAEITPELLGVGYIIGPTIASVMGAGGVLAYLVLIPLIKFFGDGLTTPLAPGNKLISQMAPDDIRGKYVLYIGAGAVAAGGIISLVRSLPLIWHGMREGLRDLGASGAAGGRSRVRTEDDLSMKVVLWGILAIIMAITFAPTLHMNVLGAVLIVLFGFLFVTVSSRLTGEIGSSSNPISGMTVATLLLTSLIFLALRWTDSAYYVTALSVGAIVCIASSNGGTISQDLKTGYLVGATPRYQQLSILVGVIASALVLGPILLRLNDAATVYVPASYVASNLKTDPSKLTVTERIQGPQAGSDTNLYRVWHRIDEKDGPAGKYLVDSQGNAVYYVDPGINGTVTRRPDGGSAPFVADDFKDPAGLAAKLRTHAAGDPVSGMIWNGLPPETQQVLNNAASTPDQQKASLANGFNKILKGPLLFDPRQIPQVKISPQASGLLSKNPNGADLARLNRLLLQDAYPAEILPSGTDVRKFTAPKATLMSYIIKGILNGELPWGLVLIGAMIAVVLEMSSIPSLAFAVGVYLPLSTSMTVFIGGLVRWLVDRRRAADLKHLELDHEQLAADADRSPGVLSASGYIAGGAIAGIVIAILQGGMDKVDAALAEFAKLNPFASDTAFNTQIGLSSDALALVPFLLLVLFLYLVGREKLLRTKHEPAA